MTVVGHLQTDRTGRAGRPPRNLRLLAAAAAGAGLVVGLGAIAVAATSSEDPGPTVAAPANPVGGELAVASAGLQVTVPATYDVMGKACFVRDVPQDLPGVVTVDGRLASGCFSGTPFPGTTVSIVASDTDLATLAPLATAPTTVGDLNARTGRGELTDGEVASVLLIPDRAAVLVRNTDEAAAQAILATAEVVETDANGCATTAPDTAGLAGASVPPAGQFAVTAEPTAATVCQYRGDVASSSGLLGASEASTLAAQIAALPAGVAAPEGPEGGPGSCPQPTSRYLVTFWTADGPGTSASVHFAGCRALYLTDGSSSRQLQQDVTTTLFQAAPFVGSWQQPQP